MQKKSKRNTTELKRNCEKHFNNMLNFKYIIIKDNLFEIQLTLLKSVVYSQFLFIID